MGLSAPGGGGTCPADSLQEEESFPQVTCIRESGLAKFIEVHSWQNRSGAKFVMQPRKPFTSN